MLVNASGGSRAQKTDHLLCDAHQGGVQAHLLSFLACTPAFEPPVWAEGVRWAMLRHLKGCIPPFNVRLRMLALKLIECRHCCKEDGTPLATYEVRLTPLGE